MKFVGLIMIMLCSSFGGLYLSSIERQKQELLEDLTSFVLFLSTEITRGRPVDFVIKEYFDTSKSRCFSVGSKMELICELEKIRTAGRMKLITSQTVEFLNRLGKSLNCMSEYDSCKKFYESISAVCAENKEYTLKYSTLYKKLGVVFGLFLCIFLM